MFNRLEKKKGGLAPKSSKDLIRLTTSEQVLEEDKRKSLLHKIEAASILEQERFKTLGLSLVHNLVNYCQLLPETANRHYSQLGGFIDYGLTRTEAALMLFKRYLLLDAQGNASEEQKLWQYALFSAALLQGIGKFYTDLQVDFFDKHANFLHSRNPLAENLTLPAASYYSYTFLSPSSDEFRQRLNSLIARFIMPAAGFDWISSNPKVLETWLALLNEDLYRAGTLGFILDRSKILALQLHYLGIPRTPLERHAHGGGPFTPGLPEPTSEKEYQLGLEFVQWLSRALEKGQIVLDQLPLLISSGGLIVNTEVFKQFIINNPQYKSWPAVQNGFLALGLHRLGLGGELISQYDHAGTHQMQKGILFAQYGLALPNELRVHDYASGKNVLISALDLTAQLQGKELQYLDSNGLWDANKQLFQKGLSPSV